MSGYTPQAIRERSLAARRRMMQRRGAVAEEAPVGLPAWSILSTSQLVGALRGISSELQRRVDEAHVFLDLMLFFLMVDL